MEIKTRAADKEAARFKAVQEAEASAAAEQAEKFKAKK